MRFFIALVVMSIFVAPAAAQRNQAPPPIITVPIPPPMREAYGPWEVRRLGSGYVARVTNASASTFGVLCSKSCAVVFNPRIKCENKARTPALINTPAGSFSVNLECRIIENSYLLFGSFSRTLYDAMEIGGELGIAFPMENGRFEVSRFSLTGALKASVRAFSLSPAGSAETGEVDGLKDQTL